MAEIKTLEHYAVTRIQDLEAEVATKKAQIEELQAQNEELQAALDKLKQRFYLQKACCDGSSRYIAFDGPWDGSPAFDKYVKLLGLNKEEE